MEIGSCYIIQAIQCRGGGGYIEAGTGGEARGGPFSKVVSHGECLRSNGSLYGVIQWFLFCFVAICNYFYFPEMRSLSFTVLLLGSQEVSL